MSAFTRLIRHTASYFTGRMAILLAGLIALPVTTRLLPKEGYGLMSLIFLLITIVTALSAFGFPQATTRYFSEQAERGRQQLARFCSSMMVGAMTAGLMAMLVVFIVNLGLAKTESFGDMAPYLSYALVLILIRQTSSVCLQIFRGNHQTFAYNIFNIANRYLSIGFIIVLLVFVEKDVGSVFIGTIVVESIVLLVTVAYLFRHRFLGWFRPESTQIRRAIYFGTPLVFADLMVSLVASSDRFAIQYFLGADSVAAYSVAYDVSDYVAILFASPVQLAILPIIYSLWAQEGADATRRFLGNTINLSLAVVIPMIAGFAVVGPDVVTFLASDKYADSGAIVGTVAFGVIIGSIHFLLFTGLLIHEKTLVITVLNGSAALFNLAMNIVLIPIFGIIGAAYATIATYILLNTATYFVSRRYIPINLDWVLLLKSLAVAGLMYWLISTIGTVSSIRILDVLARTAIGAAFYGVAIYGLEPRVRSGVADLLKRLKLMRQSDAL